MDELLKLLAPVFYVSIGWVLNQFTPFFNIRRSDNRKINKLIFNLLEVRSNIIQLKTFDIEFNQIMNRFTKTYFPKEDDIHSTAGNTIINSIGAALKTHLPNVENIDHIIREIDKGVIEISEAHPVLAFELKNQYNINSKMKALNEYIEELETKFGLYESKILTNYFEPLFLQDTIDKLDRHIRIFSKKIGRSDRKRVNKIISQKNEVDTKRIDEQVQKFVDTVNQLQGKSRKTETSPNNSTQTAG